MCLSRLRRLLSKNRPDSYPEQDLPAHAPPNPVPVSAAFAIYGEIPDVEQRLSRVLHWLARTSGIELTGDRQYFAHVPEILPDSQGLWLDQLDLSLFPDAQFIVALYFSNVSKSGLTWPYWDWRKNERPCTIATIPYVPSYGSEPFAGFVTHFEQVIAHEIKNSIISWLNQGLGYSVLNTYENDEGWINCDLFPENSRYTDCYQEVFAQITDAMRQDLATR